MKINKTTLKEIEKVSELANKLINDSGLTKATMTQIMEEIGNRITTDKLVMIVDGDIMISDCITPNDLANYAKALAVIAALEEGKDNE